MQNLNKILMMTNLVYHIMLLHNKTIPNILTQNQAVGEFFCSSILLEQQNRL